MAVSLCKDITPRFPAFALKADGLMIVNEFGCAESCDIQRPPNV